MSRAEGCEGQNLEALRLVTFSELTAKVAHQDGAPLIVVTEQERQLEHVPFRHPAAEHRIRQECSLDRAQPDVLRHLQLSAELVVEEQLDGERTLGLVIHDLAEPREREAGWVVLRYRHRRSEYFEPWASARPD